MSPSGDPQLYQNGVIKCFNQYPAQFFAFVLYFFVENPGVWCRTMELARCRRSTEAVERFTMAVYLDLIKFEYLPISKLSGLHYGINEFKVPVKHILMQCIDLT